MRKYIFIAVLNITWILLLLALLFYANIGKIQSAPDSKLITTGFLCIDEKCVNTVDIDLPFYIPKKFETKLKAVKLRFNFEFDKTTGQTPAIYLPKFSDSIAININGSHIRSHPPGARASNRPVLSQISTDLLRDGQNQLDLMLTGPPQEGLDLFPFYVGSLAQLDALYQVRTTIGIGVARFSLGLMAILFVVIGSIWLARKNDPAYLWLSLSCLSACVYLSHYGFDMSFIPYKYWTTAWTISLCAYVFLILKFIGRFLKLPRMMLESIYLWFIIGSTVILLIVPTEFIFAFVLAIHVGTVIFALGVLVVLWQNKQNSDPVDFVIFFVVLSFSLTFGIYEEVLNFLDEPSRSQHVLQYIPFIMSVVCLWLIISQLIRSLSEFETLTQSLNDTIVEKSKELANNYQALADAEKQKAIAIERQRIMLDLHDGVGGQLVNTLAYMENNNIGDHTLRSALEDALRDLALMLDALENEDNISAQLGMLRTRLEALLKDNGLEFNWQIGEEPVLPITGPSQNLHLARIAQEAITNIIKHADASIITVASTKDSLTISDNGKGFDVNKSTKKSGSHGIMSMRKRAAQIGAVLEISSNDKGVNGTVIRLQLS